MFRGQIRRLDQKNLQAVDETLLPYFIPAFHILYMSAGQLNKLNIAWNNVYRRIFGMKPWESVKRDTVSVWSA